MNKGIGLLIIATILWAGNYISGRYLGSALPPALLNTVRWAISAAILIGILSLNKKKLPVFKLWKEFAILGFTGIFAFSTLTYMALANISASQAGMISAGIPIAILFFTPFFLKEKLGAKAWAGAVISIIGVILLFQGRIEEGSAENSILGNTQVVLGCLAWGLYTVLGKRYGNKADPLILTAGAALYGTIFSAISSIGTVDAGSINMTGTAWLFLLYVSTFASVGAFLAWNVGVKMVGAGKSAPYLNLLPVWTVVLGILLLDEQISWISWAGGSFTIIGAVLASMSGKALARGKMRSDWTANN